MSSSPPESQSGLVTGYFVGLLDSCVEMFRYLDAESLLNVAKAVPEFRTLAFLSTVIKRASFDPESHEGTVEMFLRATHVATSGGRPIPIAARVQELWFTNCITLFSDVITQHARACYNLRELHCVNCIVDPAELFGLMCERVERLTKLEWSLYDQRYYEFSNDARSAVHHICTFPASRQPRLNTMYVEVSPTCSAVFVLKNFLIRCHGLLNLHVHAIRPVRYGAAEGIAYHRDATPVIIDLQQTLLRLPKLETFKYSCELLMPPAVEPGVGGGHKPSLPFRPEDLIQGNFTILVRPAPQSWNVLSLADVLGGDNVLRKFDQAIVYLEADSRAASLFEQAEARPQRWNRIARLTLALTTPAMSQFQTTPAAHAGYEKPMRRFFQTCLSRITELNLTAFHFALQCDACEIVAETLPKLCALALTPCGVNRATSLESLSCGCSLLEHIDIRSSPTKGMTSTCVSCEFLLCLTAASFKLLHERTRLRRLSIDETAKMLDLNFLNECKVNELRLSLDNVFDEELAQSPTKLGQLLSANPRLSTLTLLARNLKLSAGVANNLIQIQSLEHICVLTVETQNPYMLKYFLWLLENGLPQLRSAHVHYLGASRVMQASTWIRQRQPRCYGGSQGADLNFTKGEYMDDDTCLSRLCCLDNFIGLVRPRNRS
ncbi:hypothetical protein HPB50_005706 [Hyalomma asiaticum]|uniref:Uncharacterized protein n=1 Tax=Hyalomma asiaticum TaxID=266040 RepID=A0ACB7RR97_HYAAI|nr:hypothetical protein HPB50_005706 [Hyalomma asiaticum]